MNSKTLLILKTFSIAAALLFLFAFSLCSPPDKENREIASPYKNHAEGVKYTGIESCRACHADKYETFIKTGMGRSFDSASLQKSAADFSKKTVVYDAYLDLYYFPFISNGSMYLKEYRLDGPDTVYARTERIRYVVGSGHHTNSHLTEENGYVFQAPLTFYTQKGKWDLPPGFEQGNNTRFSRKIGLECMSCHNAMPVFDAEADNRYESLPHGISCERCHGPGEIHVREMKKGNTVDVSAETDYSIVNPRKLSWQRQIDICQRCHLQGNAVLKPGKDFSAFIPGMELSKTMDQFSPEYSDGDDFVMAAHAERFQKSKCFIASVKGDLKSGNASVGFTCISCHNPHVSVKETNTLQFNKTCAGCHAPEKKNGCSETVSRRNAKADNCVACHMPASGTSDIPHVTVHDHYIRKPSKGLLKKGSQLKGLRCVTSDKVDIVTETEAYISYYEKFDSNRLFLDKAYAMKESLDASKQTHFQTLVHLFYVAGLNRECIRLHGIYKGTYDAWTAYRLAKAYESDNKYAAAEQQYALALQAAPKNLDFILQYVVFSMKNGQSKKAVQLLQTYTALYSKTAEAWAYLGLLRMQASALSEAKQHFLKAISLDPDQLLALQNLKSLYALSGDKAGLSRTEAAIARTKRLLSRQAQLRTVK